MPSFIPPLPVDPRKTTTLSCVPAEALVNETEVGSFVWNDISTYQPSLALRC
jgi:hypothetical protein